METLRSTVEQKLWHDGPNYTADAVVIRDDALCLILRSDGGGWALPGGFRDSGELGIDAARREAMEEASIELGEGTLVYAGPVDDPRNTDTRWIETEAYLFNVAKADLHKGSDADDARWFPLSALPQQLYASHHDIIRRATDTLLLNALLEESTLLPSRGGHMAYDYELYSTIRGDVFIKRFDPANFTDPNKEMHSLYYLEKETSVIEHLRKHGFRHIASDQILVAGTSLVMEGYSETNGWHWQAPEDSEQRDSYIHDVLEALRELSTADHPPMNEPIDPPMQSFYDEGWGAYTDKSRERIVHRLDEFRGRLHEENVAQIDSLINELERLSKTAKPTGSGSVYSHHDARQRNIAWHPKDGVRIVDWSWYGQGTEKADTTALLIDLAKSDVDVTPYLSNYFDIEHAKLLIGFWLQHSLWPTRTPDDSVRLHQAASALTAYRLLKLVGPQYEDVS